MKPLPFLIALFTFFCFEASVHAQDVDKVIAHHYKKVGGIKNWEDLKSLKSNARIVQQGMENPVVLLQKLPNKQRIDIDFQGQKFVQSYNGKEGWMINPFIQTTEPKMLEGEDLKELQGQMTFDNQLINYRKKGNTVEFEGTETIEGAEYDKLKLTRKNGSVLYYLFGKDDTISVILRRTILAGPMKGQTGETYLSDYRQAGDLMMPFFVVNKIQGQTVNQINVDNWEIDPEIDDTLFDFPTK